MGDRLVSMWLRRNTVTGCSELGRCRLNSYDAQALRRRFGGGMELRWWLGWSCFARLWEFQWVELSIGMGGCNGGCGGGIS